MQWSTEALAVIKSVPPFLQERLKNMTEREAEEEKTMEISPQLVEQVREKYLGKVVNETGEGPLRVAVVRCDITSEACPGAGCLRAFHDKRVHFAGYPPDTQLIGFFTCGGCTGRRVGRLVDSLKKYNLEAVHLSSCMVPRRGEVKCAFYEQIKEAIEKKGVRVVAGTHYK